MHLRFLCCLVVVFSSIVLVRSAFAQSTTAAVRLEAGIAKEEVDGDLKSAVKIYQKIAGEATAPRREGKSTAAFLGTQSSLPIPRRDARFGVVSPQERC